VVALSGTGGHDDHWTTSDADQAVRNAAKEGRLEGSAPARADNDQLGLLLIGEIGESLGGQADSCSALGVGQAGGIGDLFDQLLRGFLLRVDLLRHHHPAGAAAEGGRGSVRNMLDLDDVGAAS
jgi:hypothetical protein